MELTLNKGMWLNENISSEKNKNKTAIYLSDVSCWITTITTITTIYEHINEIQNKNNKTTIHLSEVSTELQQHNNSI